MGCVQGAALEVARQLLQHQDLLVLGCRYDTCNKAQFPYAAPLAGAPRLCGRDLPGMRMEILAPERSGGAPHQGAAPLLVLGVPAIQVKDSMGVANRDRRVGGMNRARDELSAGIFSPN